MCVFRFDFTVYGFLLSGNFSGVVSLVLGNVWQKRRFFGVVVKV